MAIRKRKVYRAYAKDYTPVPEIRIQGKWLEDIGFSIGDTILVDYEKGEIIITKQEQNTKEAGKEGT